MSFEQPLVLQPTESFTFDVFFDARQLGLRRGQVHIFSDDPDQPLTTVNVTGTGLPDGRAIAQRGDDYVAVRYNAGKSAVVKRYVSDASGSFPLEVPSGSPFEVIIFDPDSGLVSHTNGVGGESTRVPKPFFMASVDSDSDGDGVPDDIEFAIGSARDNTDSNGDGIDDFHSLAQGIHPAIPNFSVPLFNFTTPLNEARSLPMAMGRSLPANRHRQAEQSCSLPVPPPASAPHSGPVRSPTKHRRFHWAS